MSLEFAQKLGSIFLYNGKFILTFENRCCCLKQDPLYIVYNIHARVRVVRMVRFNSAPEYDYSFLLFDSGRAVRVVVRISDKRTECKKIGMTGVNGSRKLCGVALDPWG